MSTVSKTGKAGATGKGGVNPGESGLIGGAALKAESFLGIIRAAEKKNM